MLAVSVNLWPFSFRRFGFGRLGGFRRFGFGGFRRFGYGGFRRFGYGGLCKLNHNKGLANTLAFYYSKIILIE